jgi:hypothetical protein
MYPDNTRACSDSQSAQTAFHPYMHRARALLHIAVPTLLPSTACSSLIHACLSNVHTALKILHNGAQAMYA